MQFLAATDFSTRSQRAIRRAGLLAQEHGAELALVHVVDDDQPRDLVALETREADRILHELIRAMPELQQVACRALVVTGDPFDGILRTARSVEADLIVMGSHRKQLLLDFFVGTTIERVIRMGSRPVLMVNKEAEAPYRSALAAIDISEPSANAIRTAKALNIAGHAQQTVVHAFHALARGQMFSRG
ncbi:MAG TPA: universal stress protein [Beijerinckiaceae bacterium]|jgi:nucleotide-binding universal stress UspA family protein